MNYLCFFGIFLPNRVQSCRKGDYMGPVEIAIIALVIHGLIFGFFCQQLADSKGYNPSTAFWIGFFTGIIGLLFMVGMPDKSKK